MNLKYLGLLQTIAGSETVIPIEQVLDELPSGDGAALADVSEQGTVPALVTRTSTSDRGTSKVNWSKTCFVISPIGEDGSDSRKHADLFWDL